jgi:hypothetical protein
MDKMPLLGAPDTLIDCLGRQAVAAGEQHRDRGLGAKAKRLPPGKGPHREEGFASLVEEDHLYCRLLTPIRSPGSPTFLAVERAFRDPFADLWRGRIPEHDRGTLLGYWRGRPPGVRIEDYCAKPWSPCYRPLIRVVGAGSALPRDALCDRLGFEMTFSTRLVLEHPNRLPYEITRVLAAAFLYASRRHWGLIQELIERPLERWERQQGARATGAARDRKLDALEAEYLRVSGIEMEQILRRWGVEGC